MRFRSFKRGNVSLCRSKCCKVMVYQNLSIIQSSRTQTQATCKCFDSGRVVEFLSNLLWQLITFQPFNLQKSIVPLWHPSFLRGVKLNFDELGWNFFGLYWTLIDLRKGVKQMFHVGNFLQYFQWGSNRWPSVLETNGKSIRPRRLKRAWKKI